MLLQGLNKSADQLRELTLRTVGLKRDPGPGPAHPALVSAEAIPPRPANALRLVSLNVGHGRRTATHQALLLERTARRNVSEVGRILHTVRADVLALQEADGPSAWSGNFDHVESLARHARLLHHYRGDHNPFGSPRFPLASGTALLSAWPLGERLSRRFRSNWRDTKGFVVATIRVPRWRDLEIDLVSVHLDFLRPALRRQQILRMVEELQTRRGQRPMVVLGDLNCCWQREPDSLRLLAETLGVRPFEPQRTVPTFPAHNPRRRLDWILVSRELTWHAHHTLRTPLSDHLGIVGDVVPVRSRRTAPCGRS
ncbi:MAG: endonuclease/exonuclease/phosphatase family protein [Acidobacteriota bacterium]